MLKRFSQPPVNPALRDTEIHGFWLGCAVAVAALLLILYGALHLTRIQTVDGDRAWETQLVRAFSSGGVQYPQKETAPPPPRLDDPAAMVDALNRWASHQDSHPPAPTWKVRIDAKAKAACPT